MNKFYKIFLFLIVFISLSTYTPRQFQSTIKNEKSYFDIEHIEVNGNLLIKEGKIINELKNIYEKNIFLVKKKDIEKPLSNINFLEKVEVKKKYPNTIVIKIFETKPIGYLFKNKEKYLIDSLSNLILLNEKNNSFDLPSIFGENSEKYYISFLKRLEKNNFPSKKIKNYYYFKIGRWDIKLENDKIIKFPHNNIDEAITKSVELLKREDFQNHNIIDLRVEGKIIVE